jgi:rubrerythrin
MPPSRRDPDEIFASCVLMEMQAIHLYTYLAARAENEEARRILRYLAEMEESHIGRLVELIPRPRKDAADAVARADLLEALRSDSWTRYKARVAGAGITEDSPADDYLTFAAVAEAHAQAHYERLRDEADDPSVKETFRTLSREEADHGRQIRRIQTLLAGNDRPR